MPLIFEAIQNDSFFYFQTGGLFKDRAHKQL
jgi:hypothetical protein